MWASSLEWRREHTRPSSKDHPGTQQREILSKPVPAFPVSPVLCLDSVFGQDWSEGSCCVTLASTGAGAVL